MDVTVLPRSRALFRPSPQLLCPTHGHLCRFLFQSFVLWPNKPRRRRYDCGPPLSRGFYQHFKLQSFSNQKPFIITKTNLPSHCRVLIWVVTSSAMPKDITEFQIITRYNRKHHIHVPCLYRRTTNKYRKTGIGYNGDSSRRRNFRQGKRREDSQSHANSASQAV